MNGEELDPRQYGLPGRSRVIRLPDQTIALLVERKSRVIMADARKLLAKAGKIQEQEPQTKVALYSSAPICSKSKIFLEEQGIAVYPLPGKG